MKRRSGIWKLTTLELVLLLLGWLILAGVVLYVGWFLFCLGGGWGIQ